MRSPARPRWRGWRLAPALLLAIVLVASCTSSEDETGDEARDTAPPTTAASEATGSGADDASDPSVASLRIADLNVLHGLPMGACPAETEDCQAAARLERLWELVEDAGCPEVLTLQEIGRTQLELIPATLPDVCDGAYEIATPTGLLPVEQWIITSLPVLETASTPIAGISRTAQLVRVDSAVGPVDVITTHFVASIDRGPCDDQLCPSGVCEPGLDNRLCNAQETVAFAEAAADAATPTIITGDLNDEIGSDALGLITGAGFADVWTQAGLDECDPATAANCTSGQGGDGPYDGLDLAENLRDERIDYILVGGGGDCALEPRSAALFADTPADPPLAGGVYWVSDHIGVQAELICAKSD